MRSLQDPKDGGVKYIFHGMKMYHPMDAFLTWKMYFTPWSIEGFCKPPTIPYYRSALLREALMVRSKHHGAGLRPSGRA